MIDSLLSGFQALDLTDEKGFVCGQILAALGVNVIKVEKPGGDLARSIPPFIHDIADPGKSLYWLAFNSGKRSITLNLEVSKGQAMFRKLVEKADFVLESFTPGYMDSLGLGYEVLSRINPRIIMTSITLFGQKGPYRNYKGCDLIVSAMSGVLSDTGDPDRPPVKEGLDACYFHGDAAAALGTVMGHYFREITGEGQWIDVSLQEVAVSRNPINLIKWEFEKGLIKRSGPQVWYGANLVRSIWPCKDGYIAWLYLGGPIGAPGNRALSQWIDEDGLENPLSKVAKWEELDMATMPREMLDSHEQAICKFFMNHTVKEIAVEGLKRGTNASIISNPAEVLKNEQLEARNYWVELECSELGAMFKYPKSFFLSNQTENFIRRCAPFVGEDNDAIYINGLGLSSVEISALKDEGVI